jgi:hypothetical protein
MLFRRRTTTPEQLILQYERKVYRLWKENQDLRFSALETRREIAGFYSDLQKLKTDLAESEKKRNADQVLLEKLVNSRGWQILGSGIQVLLVTVRLYAIDLLNMQICSPPLNALFIRL